MIIDMGMCKFVHALVMSSLLHYLDVTLSLHSYRSVSLSLFSTTGLRVPYTPADGSGLRPNAVTDVTNGKARRLMKPQGVCGKHNYMSPEVFRNTENFDGFAIDLWAAGVILYIMLTGFPPYDQASRTDQRFELIVTGRLMEQLRNWGIFLTDEAGDLMQRMLQLSPKKRMSLADVMSHPWVTNGHVEKPAPAERLIFH